MLLIKPNQKGYLDGVEEIVVTSVRSDQRFNAIELSTGVSLYGIPLDRFKSEKREDLNGTN